jgi:hypothetical protein
MGLTSSANKEDEVTQIINIIDLVKKHISKELDCSSENELKKKSVRDDYMVHTDTSYIKYDSLTLGKTFVHFIKDDIYSIDSEYLTVKSSSTNYEIQLLKSSFSYINCTSFPYLRIIFGNNNICYSNDNVCIFGYEHSNVIPKNKLYACIKKIFRYPDARAEEFEKTFIKLGYIDNKTNGPSTLEELKKVCDKMNIEYELDLNDVIDIIMSRVKSVLIKYQYLGQIEFDNIKI